MPVRESNSRPGGRWAFWSSLVCSFLVILVTVFRLSLRDALTFFIAPLIFFAVFVLFLAVLVWTLVIGLRGLWRRQLAPLLPSAIAILTLAAVVFVPIEQWLLDYDFYVGLSSREEVVRAIESGRSHEGALTVTSSPPVGANSYLIRLPANYSHLSRGGGEVSVERGERDLSVLFWTERGFFDGISSGFLFSPSDQVPAGLFHRHFLMVRQLQEHWYWVVY